MTHVTLWRNAPGRRADSNDKPGTTYQTCNEKTSALRQIALRRLFAGAGGFSLAARRARLKVVAAVEQDAHACKTYRANLVLKGFPNFYETDITQFKPAMLVRECFGEGEDCDIVLGGPPCQGFSVHRINDAGKGDPRNELIHRYFEYVKALKPSIFLLENVPGILWTRHAGAVGRFYAEAKRAGYNVMPPATLEAKDYGIPQGRKRVFFLGVRKDLGDLGDWIPPPTHGSPTEIMRRKNLKEWVPCKEVFSKPHKK